MKDVNAGRLLNNPKKVIFIYFLKRKKIVFNGYKHVLVHVLALL